jgi:hypothetical protein
MTFGAAETTPTVTTRPDTEPILVLISELCSLLTTRQLNRCLASVMPKPAIFRIGQSLQLANCRQQKTTPMCGAHSKNQVSPLVVQITSLSELTQLTNAAVRLAM